MVGVPAEQTLFLYGRDQHGAPAHGRRRGFIASIFTQSPKDEDSICIAPQGWSDCRSDTRFWSGRPPVLDNDQGFGKVNLDALLSPAPPMSAFFADVRPGLRTGQIRRRTIKVTTANQPALRLVLAYSDYPGRTMVNNLNLFVISPSGQRHVRNASPGNPTGIDVINNVEVVHIPNPAAGTWTVRPYVRGLG